MRAKSACTVKDWMYRVYKGHAVKTIGREGWAIRQNTRSSRAGQVAGNYGMHPGSRTWLQRLQMTFLSRMQLWIGQEDRASQLQQVIEREARRQTYTASPQAVERQATNESASDLHMVI